MLLHRVMLVIAVANQKGGCGKTTIAREFSACLALRGYRVLVVDADPQGNLTSSWVDLDSNSVTLAHVLISPDRTGNRQPDPLELVDAIAETPLEGLDLVPTDIRLARFEKSPAHAVPRLAAQIRLHAGSYDFVIIDCPPQLGVLLTAALYAAEWVLVPCKADAMGLSGLTDLAETVREIRRDVNPELKMLGAVVNLYKPQRNLSAEARAAIEEAIALVGHVFETNIHDYSKIAEAPSQREPVLTYAPSHRASDQLSSLTDEVLDTLRTPRQRIAAVK